MVHHLLFILGQLPSPNPAVDLKLHHSMPCSPAPINLPVVHGENQCHQGWALPASLLPSTNLSSRAPSPPPCPPVFQEEMSLSSYFSPSSPSPFHLLQDFSCVSFSNFFNLPPLCCVFQHINQVRSFLSFTLSPPIIVLDIRNFQAPVPELFLSSEEISVIHEKN